jgi:hypothetical protein
LLAAETVCQPPANEDAHGNHEPVPCEVQRPKVNLGIYADRYDSFDKHSREARRWLCGMTPSCSET